MDGVSTRGTFDIPYVVECLLCAEETEGRLRGGWVTPPDSWWSGGGYFVCDACARMVRQAGISIVYSSASDSNLRLRVSWDELKDGKGMPLWRQDLVI